MAGDLALGYDNLSQDKQRLILALARLFVEVADSEDPQAFDAAWKDAVALAEEAL